MAGGHVEVCGSRNGGCRGHEGGLFSGGQQPFLAAETSPGCCLCPPCSLSTVHPWQGLFCSSLLCTSWVCLKFNNFPDQKLPLLFSEVCDPWRALKDCGKSATNTKKAGL